MCAELVALLLMLSLWNLYTRNAVSPVGLAHILDPIMCKVELCIKRCKAIELNFIIFLVDCTHLQCFLGVHMKTALEADKKKILFKKLVYI